MPSPAAHVPDFRVSVAPMMDWSDRHYRYFMRQLSRRAVLYSEMVTTGALLHGNVEAHVAYSPVEKPLVLQLGGDDPEALAQCAQLAESWGYDEVNLNVGCPSSRVQNGNFGACLMARPQQVAACMAAMQAAVTIPVTVKQRIGIDNLDRYEDMANFVAVVAEAGVKRFIVHARKAWLQGLSPKENRNVPPLRYEDVYRLKRDFPQLQIELNGGVTRLVQMLEPKGRLDGVMLGRAAYENPYLFASVDSVLYQQPYLPTRRDVVLAMLPYIEQQLQQGVYLSRISRHMLGLFAHQAKGKAWRRHLSEHAHRPGAGPEVLLAALEHIPDSVQHALPATLNEESNLATPQATAL